MSTSPIAARVRRHGAVSACVLLAACAVPFATYTVSSSNITAIRATQRRVELGDFLGKQATASCRLRRIGPDGDRTFAQYVRAAFNDELVIADARTTNERSTLSLKVKNVDVDCGNFWGSWTIEAEVQITNQAPFSLKVVHEFDGNFIPDIVWQRANQSFVPAVQELIAAVIANPAFKDEFGNRRPGERPAESAAKTPPPSAAPATASQPEAGKDKPDARPEVGVGKGIAA